MSVNKRKYDKWVNTDRNRILQARRDIIARCYNDNNKYWHRYGGRGIKLCGEWLNDREAFYQWSIEHGYRKGLEIDRIDNDGDYTPENCRWVDRHTNINNRYNTPMISVRGETKCLMDWCREYGRDRRIVYNRIFYWGWNPEDAILTETVHRKPSELYTIDGETHTAYKWAKIKGISTNKVLSRIRNGYSIEEALDDANWLENGHREKTLDEYYVRTGHSRKHKTDEN